MIAIVVGIPGTGKTSVAKGLVPHGWKVVGFGSIMFEIAKEKYGITHRDKLRTDISVKDYRILQDEAATKISKMKGNIIVDTHCSMRSPKGYYPGLPLNVLKKLEPSSIISIEADPEEIQKRREKDAATRVRFSSPKEHQEVNRYFAAVYSVLSLSPVAFVMNHQGKLKKTIDQVLEILKEVKAHG
ncbi:MAG: adenylate kinase [Candidatus Altiarchaeota archaeon]|nr:adenylate kinase [Candidatus Altiarchaeota archaeon]